MEYRHPGSSSVKKFKALMPATKVMLTIFWDASDALYTEFLTKGLTVNSDRVVPQPYYSPDLAPSDFCLFPKLKESLKGQRILTKEEVQEAVRLWVRSQPGYFYVDGMKKCIERLNKCVAVRGDC
ncbi:uncharacterized protein TNCV_70141 [Trichonephila clavipes]|nr:uncharacterized protein TNCV_70141 [Trichonephila clavipes]